MRNLITVLKGYAPVLSIEEAVQFASDSAVESYNAAIEAGQSETRAGVMAGEAYCACLPALTSMSNVKAYIAVVAEGVHHKFIDGRDGRLMLYAAQLAIAVHAEGK